MSLDIKNTVSSCALKCKIITFCVGIIIGSIGSFLWQELFTSQAILERHVVTNEQLALLKSETGEKLLKYIEGKWRSSIGDLIVNIDDSNIDGSFVVIENLTTKPTRQEIFKVVSIEKVDGLFGIVNLTLCSVNSSCKNHHYIPIQINKIFGLQKTITMSYDERFSYCLKGTECTRAFEEVEEK